MSLKLRPFMRYMRDLNPGETKRLNHGEACRAGNEVRRRLYLTRTLADPCVVIGYCHNCAEGGKISDTQYMGYRESRHSTVQNKPMLPCNTNLLPMLRKGIGEMELWPNYAMAWAIKGKIGQELASKYYIKFLVSEDRILLPMFTTIVLENSRSYGDLFGIQTRSVNGQAPKYLTNIKKDSLGYTSIKRKETRGDRVTIVEDLISGINIMASNADTDVIVNYGTKINPHVVGEASKYNQVCVWLDNDADFIRQQAEIYSRTIKLYNDTTRVYVISQFKDPKQYTYDEITKVIGP